MEKYGLLILIFVLPIYLWSQNNAQTNTTSGFKDTLVTKEFYSKETYSDGINIKTEGKISQRQYSNQYDVQIRIGAWKSYYVNGQLKDSTFYDRRGNIIGIEKHYYKNGNIKAIYDYDTTKGIQYKEQLLLNSLTVYGVDYYTQVYSKDNANILLKEGRTKQKKKTGEWKFYTKIGKLKKVIYYENGKIKNKIKY